MRIKSVVKVMNFHALLRVNKSKKVAERFFEYEKELSDFVNCILNNRNIILDKKILKMNKHGRDLNIYIGNDMGFCGDFNSNLNQKAREDNSDKIVIGKKIFNNKKNVLLQMEKSEYDKKIDEIGKILYDGIKNVKYKEINIIYNHYYNISKIELIKKTVLPLKKEDMKTSLKEDFVVEGDINDILINIVLLYLLYEIKVAQDNSYASENIMRQSTTNESLKRIDEMEKTKTFEELKAKRNKELKKNLEFFINQKTREHEE